MDFANFSQSLTPVLPRGHRGLSSSCGTEPTHGETEMPLPLLQRRNVLVQPDPLSPSKQPLSSTWIFKTFSWNNAEETSGFLYKASLPAAPCHSSECTWRGSTHPTSSWPPSHNTLCSEGFILQQPSLPLSLYSRGLQEVNAAFSTGNCCHCLVPAEGRPKETSQLLKTDHSSWKQTHKDLPQGWPIYRLQLLNLCSSHRKSLCLPAARRVKKPTTSSQQAKTNTPCSPFFLHTELAGISRH